MSIIKIFSGTYCFAEDIYKKVSEKSKFKLMDDQYVVEIASNMFNTPENKIFRTLNGKVSAFNNFTHERERNVSFLKLVVSELLERDEFILTGFSSLLIPPKISHVLSVCIIADFNHRLDLVIKETNLSRKEAIKLIHKEDEKCTLWSEYIVGKNPWDSDIYDILIPTNKVQVDDGVELILENLKREILKPTETSLQAVKDFILSSKVQVELVKAGHSVSVSANKGIVTLIINKQTLMLSRLEEELKKITSKIKGVEEINTKVGPGFYQVDIYRQFDPELPSRVLLVDDEIEFVQTLSERLQMRDIGSAVVYDGEQALSFVDEEEPEVIVLDLKMPGIDGIEVLKRVKSKHPNIEIIVLTGHGSDKDRETCMELGAYAYLQKPVDIEKLSAIMQEAYRKVKGKNSKN
ncbi:response regulator [bacterium]|nr:response regulator [bacterium]